MSSNYQWNVDEDDDKSGKQRILSSEYVHGFDAQRAGHGNNWSWLLALVVPLVVLIIIVVLGWR